MTTTPSGSSALTKDALLATPSLTPNLTWSNIVAPENEQDSNIAKHIFALLDRRSHGATICPSEVARAMHGSASQWRAAMPAIRAVAAALADRGLLRVTRGGEQVDATRAGGPIRLGRPE